MSTNDSPSRVRLQPAERRLVRLVGCLGVIAVVPVYALVTAALVSQGWLVRPGGTSSTGRVLLLVLVAVLAGVAATAVWWVRPTDVGAVPKPAVPRRRVAGALVVGIGWGWLALGEVEHHLLGTVDFDPSRHPALLEAGFHLVGILVGAVGWAAATFPVAAESSPIALRAPRRVARTRGLPR